MAREGARGQALPMRQRDRIGFLGVHACMPPLPIRTLLIVGLMLARPVAADAQGTRVPGSGTPPDSAAWTPILAYVMRSLAHHTTRAALDTTTQAWHMTLPDSAPKWRGVETQLRLALRARAVAPADSIFFELRLGPMQVDNDTARAVFTTSMTRRCANSNQTTGYGNHEIIYAFRFGSGRLSAWSSGRSDGVRHGDRVGCPRRLDGAMLR